MDVLHRIKRIVFRGGLRFTRKAREEMETDGLTEAAVSEAIVSAPIISKVLRSRSPHRTRSAEKLYVIKGLDFSGTLIYTKGRFGVEDRERVFYVLISSKIATYDE